MPGKEAWKRTQGHTGADAGEAGPIEPTRLPAHQVDDAITDLEISLELDDLTAPLDSVAGEPVSPSGTESIPTPLDASVIDFKFSGKVNVFVCLISFILFLIVIISLVLALLFSEAFSLFWILIAFVSMTYLVVLVSRFYR